MIEPLKVSKFPSYTEVALSEQFSEIYHDDLKYNIDVNNWFFWDGARWKQDQRNQQTQENAKTVIIGIYQDAAKETDSETRKNLLKFAERQNSRSGISNLLFLSQYVFTITDQNFDLDPHLLNTPSGTYNLVTTEIQPFSKEDYITKITGTEFKKEVACPLWLSHLEKCFDGNKDLIQNFKEICGYLLYFGNPDGVFCVLYGSGKNGKSVTIRIIENILGDYAISVNPQSFMEIGNHPGSDRLLMKNARLITSIETGTSGKYKLDAPFVKAITGGDTLSERKLYCESQRFKVGGVVFLATNAKPRVPDQSIGMWERLWLIPFNHYFPPEERDKEIVKKLNGEKPGILNWMIEGCQDYKKRGYLQKCAAICEETEEYKHGEDWYSPFIDDTIKILERGAIKAREFYSAYVQWCASQIPQIKARSETSFGREMGVRFRKKRGNDGRYEYHGIGFRGQSNL